MPTQHLHHFRDTVFRDGRCQKMHVIGHEYPSVNCHPALLGKFIQPIGISGKIFF
jgi:hypothetical protein